MFLIALAVTGFVYFLTRPRVRSHLGCPQNRYIYLIPLAYVLSEAQHFWLYEMARVGFFWYTRVFLYYLVIRIMKDERDLKLTILGILSAVTVMTWIGWEQYFSPEGQFFGDRLSSLGYYNNPNTLAFLLTLAFPLSFSMMEIERNALKKAVLVSFMIFLIISCVYTKSRGGGLGMAAAVVLSLLFSKSLFKSRSLKIAASILVILLFIGIVIPFVVLRPDVNSFLGAGGEASAGDRQMAWIAGIRMFIDHPVFGIGWDHFTENALDYGMDKRLIAHNTAISMLAETGMIGFACLFCIVFYSLRRLLQTRRVWSSDNEKAVLLTLSSGVMVSFLCFFVNGTFGVLDQDPIYWGTLSLVGVLCAIGVRERESQDGVVKAGLQEEMRGPR